VGIHTGEPGLDPPKYVGADVHRAARVMPVGSGGQVLLSMAARELVDVEVHDRPSPRCILGTMCFTAVVRFASAAAMRKVYGSCMAARRDLDILRALLLALPR